MKFNIHILVNVKHNILFVFTLIFVLNCTKLKNSSEKHIKESIYKFYVCHENKI